MQRPIAVMMFGGISECGQRSWFQQAAFESLCCSVAKHGRNSNLELYSLVMMMKVANDSDDESHHLHFNAPVGPFIEV